MLASLRSPDRPVGASRQIEKGESASGSALPTSVAALLVSRPALHAPAPALRASTGEAHASALALHAARPALLATASALRATDLEEVDSPPLRVLMRRAASPTAREARRRSSRCFRRQRGSSTPKPVLPSPASQLGTRRASADADEAAPRPARLGGPSCKPRSGAFSIALGVSPGCGAPPVNKPPKGRPAGQGQGRGVGRAEGRQSSGVCFPRLLQLRGLLNERRDIPVGKKRSSLLRVIA